MESVTPSSGLMSVTFLGETYQIGDVVQLMPYLVPKPTQQDTKESCSPKETEFWIGSIQVAVLILI